MIEYAKPRSGAGELIGALDEGAQTLLALQADRKAAEKAATDDAIAAAKNELEALQRQRDMITVQAEIDALQRATPPARMKRCKLKWRRSTCYGRLQNCRARSVRRRRMRTSKGLQQTGAIGSDHAQAWYL